MVIRQRISSCSQALLLFALAAGTSTADDIWAVSIDEAPAPPPQDVPPFSAGAIRDPSFLKYQIIAIVGSYVLTVLVLGTALLTIGKKWRREAQQSTSSLAMEMVKPSTKWQKPSPISPAESTRSWRKWTSREKMHQSARSTASIDAKVVEADRSRRQEEMERLYAAVMAENARDYPEGDYEDEIVRPHELQHLENAAYHPDSKDPEQAPVATREVDPVTGQILSHTRTPSGSSRSFSQRRPPPRLDTSTPVTDPGQNPGATSAWTGSTVTATSQTMHTPSLPAPAYRPSPKSPVRAIYPPSAALPADYENPISPNKPNYQFNEPRNVSPPKQHYQQQQQQKQNQPPTSYPISHGLPSSPRSPPQQRRTSSSSTRTKPRSVRDLTISAPIQQHRYQYNGTDEDELEAHCPLSPSSPPAPSLRTSPGTPYSYNRTPVQDGDYVQDEDIIEAYGYEGLEQRRPLPPSSPHRSEAQYDQDYQQHRPRPTKTPPPGMPTSPHYVPPEQQLRPPPIPPTITIQPYSAQSSTRSLPLRSPKSANTTTSPGPTKTTFLSPRKDKFNVSTLPAGFAPMQTPRTQAATGGAMRSPVGTVGMPSPYSPYMPRTPMTPVTPGLMSPRERKERKRDEGRRVLGEQDKVGNPADVWADGWD